VFISLMRAQGIPARFEIGFPLAEAPAGEIAGYHCWAEFYLDKMGWVPVDISEAWKAPAKHDYFFGSLDANRIRFSTGRDLTLEPRQAGPPLNYFVYPYVEVDGKPFEGSLERRVSYAPAAPTLSR
jgi:transglutaminase-like putative cysteine protease